MEDILNDDNRIAVMAGVSKDNFQIPNKAGLQPDLGLTVNGQSAFPSENLSENQSELTEFGVISLQHSEDRFDLQSSVITRFSSLSFTPDLTSAIKCVSSIKPASIKGKKPNCTAVG